MLTSTARSFVPITVPQPVIKHYRPNKDAVPLLPGPRDRTPICISDLFVPQHHNHHQAAATPHHQPPPAAVFSGHVKIVIDCELTGIVPRQLQEAPAPTVESDAMPELCGNQILSAGVLVVLQTSADASDINQFLVLDQFFISLNLGANRTKADWERLWASFGWSSSGCEFWKRNIGALNSLFVPGDYCVLVETPGEMANMIDATLARWRDTSQVISLPRTRDRRELGVQVLSTSVMFDTGSQDQYWINELLVSSGYSPLFITAQSLYAGPFSVIDSFAIFSGALGLGPFTPRAEVEEAKNVVKNDRTFFIHADCRHSLRPPADNLTAAADRTRVAQYHNPLWDAYTVIGYYIYAQRHSAALNQQTDARNVSPSRGIKKVKSIK